MTAGERIAVAEWPGTDVTTRLVGSEAVVYVGSLLACHVRLAAAVSLLSPSERTRFEAYANAVVSRRFAVGRAALREALGQALGVPPADVRLREGRHGKPVLSTAAGRPLWFSVAHCEEVLLIALSRRADVGVDVERVRSIEHWERVAERVLDPQELRQLRREVDCGEDAGEAFLGHWCRVEAELKAIGCGIAGLEAHRAGRRPPGLRVTDLGAVALPRELGASGARYRAAVALCSPRFDGASQTATAVAQAAAPTIPPATASTA